jgi:tetratricopeptide (TPR) repeat protein
MVNADANTRPRRSLPSVASTLDATVADRESKGQNDPDRARESARNSGGAAESAVVTETGKGKGPVSAPMSEMPSNATPEDLLARASTLRRAQRYGDALRIYETVLARYPGTRQARVARVAAAEIELSQLGDPRAAQQRFAEVESDAELGPEALFGTAEACKAQGDVAGERRALQRLLREHPDSPLANAARRRLAAKAAP